MLDSTDLSTVIDVLDKKIAKLNMSIVKNKTEELESELTKYLKIKQEIMNGNVELIEKLIKGEV